METLDKWTERKSQVHFQTSLPKGWFMNTKGKKNITPQKDIVEFSFFMMQIDLIMHSIDPANKSQKGK